MAEEETTNEQQAAAAGNGEQPQFSLQRIYVKDLSFESPGAPDAFQKQWAPEVKLDINTTANKIQDQIFEVVLSLTVTVKNEGQTAYLIEVQQAGLFSIKGVEGAGLQNTLGAFCPNIIFPYAREAVDSILNRGNFPPLYLAPVNFEAVYAESMKRRAEAAEEAPVSTH